MPSEPQSAWSSAIILVSMMALMSLKDSSKDGLSFDRWQLSATVKRRVHLFRIWNLYALVKIKDGSLSPVCLKRINSVFFRSRGHNHLYQISSPPSVGGEGRKAFRNEWQADGISFSELEIFGYYLSLTEQRQHAPFIYSTVNSLHSLLSCLILIGLLNLEHIY